MQNKKQVVWLSVVVAVVTVGIILLSVLTSLQKESFPTFMDAKGTIVATQGSFSYEKQAYIGDVNAPVKVIEFFDYKCPPCAAWSNENFPQFKKEYIDTGKVQLYYINFPFLGPDSIKAAMMAEIMWNQNPKAFAEFHKAIAKYQKVESDIWATEKYLLEIVEKYVPSGDAKKAKESIRALEGLFEVKEDFKITTANGVSGTPTFFVNGVKTSSETLSETITNEFSLKDKSTK